MKTLKTIICIFVISAFSVSLLTANSPAKEHDLKMVYKKARKEVGHRLYSCNLSKILDHSISEKLDIYVIISNENTLKITRIEGSNQKLNTLTSELLTKEPVNVEQGFEGKRMVLRYEFKNLY